MELQFYKCIFVGLACLLVAVIFYIYKKSNFTILFIFIGILFFVRSGIVYMAMDFEPPEIKEMEKEEIESEPTEIPEVNLSMPKFNFYDNGNTGFGLDFLDQE